MKSSIAIFLILVFVVSGYAADSCLVSLVESEKAFAEMAAERGTKDAFVFYLADDSVIFKPEPVSGKEWYASQPARPSLLGWDPARAECSCGLGYTTGPWDYRAKAGEEPIAYGNYVSLWRKQREGAWKVVLDAGTGNPRPNDRPQPFSTEGQQSATSENYDAEVERAVLLNAERELSRASAAQGLAKALHTALADHIRLLREEMQPVIGKEAVLSYLEGSSVRLKWEAAKAEVSSCADFGYTYGMAEIPGASGPAKAIYVRIWRKQDGRWKIVLDLLSPIPPEPSS